MSIVLSITDEEMASLTQSILTRYGIDFTCYEPKSLKRRVVRVLNMHSYTSIHELWVRILTDRAFIYSFMNEVSVGMTSMFRDPIFWHNLKRRLLKSRGEQSSLSIWHAGCSTGEEAYSMGILLSETGLLSKSTALATDINQDALDAAKRGEYHKIKMIENERNYKQYNSYSELNKYYSSVDGKTIKMDPRLISHVNFSFNNLISDNAPGSFDMILCRNVMIYFDAQAKKNLLLKFHKALNPGGFFVIGFYDTMLQMIDQKLFRLVDEDAKIFQRVDQ